MSIVDRRNRFGGIGEQDGAATWRRPRGVRHRQLRSARRLRTRGIDALARRGEVPQPPSTMRRLGDRKSASSGTHRLKSGRSRSMGWHTVPTLREVHPPSPSGYGDRVLLPPLARLAPLAWRTSARIPARRHVVSAASPRRCGDREVGRLTRAVQRGCGGSPSRRARHTRLRVAAARCGSPARRCGRLR